MANQIQSCFERYEKKYMLTPAQLRVMLTGMKAHMVPDQYGKYTICNIYYDTPDWRLIRASLEKPVYKEKLRVRSYGRAGMEDTVFVELKKKYRSVVYKRRLSLPQDLALSCLSGASPWPQSQIGREIAYAMEFYPAIAPQVFLSYERDSFQGKEDEALRITFDTDLRFRTTGLSLDTGTWGREILPRDRVLMELKVPGGLPLWLARTLSQNKIFQTSFSKYGTVYQMLQENKSQEV